MQSPSFETAVLSFQRADERKVSGAKLKGKKNRGAVRFPLTWRGLTCCLPSCFFLAVLPPLLALGGRGECDRDVEEEEEGAKEEVFEEDISVSLFLSLTGEEELS